ncbi:MAG: tRNA (adenosine(37)-N6)-threonylcarbamoyltransferase complex dimerization subunit type 1 TsaB [Oscillospiraceae bacterium]|nr:tRNA (adenosine(37)-N6)-threonylcarbamoyltransferase complex dimerization subunit type 1 TsaB [Oscillospiraceae bacterium]
MILALDCSSKTASAALVNADGRLIAQGFINAGLTHSETLMPLIAGLLEQTKTTKIERIAVTSGPGSFTGLRIGAAAAQGLGLSLGAPVCGVSSLEAAAWNAAHMGGYIRAVMDARRGQVYTALFYAENSALSRITPDEARDINEIFDKIGILVGDGAEMCYNIRNDFTLAPPHLRYPTGYGAAMAACRGGVSAGELNYLRIPQAERERNEKERTG